MQILPTEDILADSQAVKQKSSTNTDQNAFQSIYANYIEEDRYDYSGRPAGFAAQEENSGTLSNREAENLKKALRERNVAEEYILALDQLLQNGSMTVGNAFKLVSGMGGRLTEALGDKERDSFKMLLGKMGMSKDQVEAMLNMSDEGGSTALLRNLRQAFDNLDGTLDVTKEEFSSMLRALDVSDSTMNKIMGLLGNQEEFSLSGPDMAALLGDASRELALRDKNALHAKTQMRAALDDALTASKSEELAAQVDDVRGNRRSEQLRIFMEDTILNNTGVDRIKKEFGDGDDFSQDRNAERGWRSLFADAETRSKGRGKDSESSSSQAFERIGVSSGFSIFQNTASQARNLDMIADKFGKEIFTQVEQGILQNIRNGSQRLTLQLAPEELGKLNIVLSMQQGELKALITAENSESAALLSEQMAELKAALEEQGIKVAELDVQTELRDNRFGEQWNDHSDHNEMSDSRERDRAQRLSRLRREQSGQESAAESAHRASIASEQGLHIVA